MIIAIFPGRFQPFHRGHATVFDYLQHEFGAENSFIATSNTQSDTSPFDFDEKTILANRWGYGENMRYTKSPYKPHEITDNYDGEQDKVIFALSIKDQDRFEITNSSYFQHWDADLNLKSFSEHAYILTVPTFKFKIAGNWVNSATGIRNAYTLANEKTRRQIIRDLYGEYDPEIKALFDRKLA